MEMNYDEIECNVQCGQFLLVIGLIADWFIERASNVYQCIIQKQCNDTKHRRSVCLLTLTFFLLRTTLSLLVLKLSLADSVMTFYLLPAR